MAILISKKDKASESSEGLVRFATTEEATAGQRSDVAMSPALVKAQLDGLSGNAPADLDSFEELAAAINNDANFHTTVQNDIDDLQTQINTLAGGDLSGLQDEIDDTQAGAGLGTDGSYTADNTTNYITAATSLKDADRRLDAQIKQNADDIASLGNGNLAAIQSEIDDIESSIGIGTDGSYTAPSGTNYIDSATSVRNEISLLDTQLKSTQDDLDTAETSISDHETRITTLESSGDVDAVQDELDVTQTGAGLATDGTYSANGSANYISGATSLKNADDLLDTQLKSTQDDLDTAEASIATNTSNISTNTTNIATNATDISNLESLADTHETAVGLNANGTYQTRSGTNYIDSATSIRAEIGLLDAQVSTNATDITNINTTIQNLTSEGDTNSDAITALQTEVNTTQAGAGLSTTGAYTAPGASNYLGSATSLKNADDLLDAQIKTNADNIASNDTDIASLQTSLSGKASDADLTALEGVVDQHETSIGLNANGTLPDYANENYITSQEGLVTSIEVLDAQVASNATSIATKASSSSVSDLQTEVDNIESGAGLGTDGTYSANGSSNYISAATSLKDADNKLDAQIKTNADNIASNDADIATNASNISTNTSNIATNTSDITSLESLADTHESSIGLDADGGFTADATGNYTSGASSVRNEIELLDAQVKTNADNIASNDSDISTINTTLATKASDADLTSLEGVVDQHESSIGLAANGTYVSRSGTNYLDGSSSIVGEITALDTQLKSTQDDLDTAETSISNLQTLADTHETSIGLNADGTYTAPSGTNYIDSSTSVRNESVRLDSQVKTNADAIALRATTASLASLQSEVDATQSGAGLAANGNFVAYSGTNYLDASTDLADAIDKLDVAVKARQDNIDSEASTRASADSTLQGKIDTVEASVGLGTDGSLSISGTNYLNSSTSIVDALDTLDTNVKSVTDIQGNIKTSAGLSADGTKTAYSSTNYISGSLKAAIEALDTQVKSNADDIAGLGGSDIANLQSELDDTQSGVGLATDGTHVSRSGTNYLDSATSIVGEISALDTALKSEETARTSADTAQVGRLEVLEHRCGGIFIDVPASSAVEMDATLSSFRSHTGPWQVDFSAFRTGGLVDIIMYGGQAATNSSQHFIQKNNGDIVFTGNISAGASIRDDV